MPEKHAAPRNPESEADLWKNVTLPINLFDRLMLQFARILLSNGEAPGGLTSEDKKARTKARVDATEMLVLLCERTEDDKVFRV